MDLETIKRRTDTYRVTEQNKRRKREPTTENRQPATGNRQLLSPRPYLGQAPQHLRNGPGLSGAAAGDVGGLGVEDFADRADAGVGERAAEAVDEAERA